MKEIPDMSTLTPEFQSQISTAFEKMQSSQSNEEVFGAGFILVRANSPEIENLKKNGEVLNSISIEGVDLLVISPGINE